MRRYQTMRIGSLDEFASITGWPSPMAFLAGATDIMVQAHKDTLPAAITLVDISAMEELRGIRMEEKELVLGSLTTHGEVMASPFVARYANGLREACSIMGSPQVRNRGTLGGNICHGSPAGDSIPPLHTLDAVLVLARGNARRRVPIREFHTGPGKTVRQPDELLLEIRIQAREERHGDFLRLGQRGALAISKVSVALAGTLEGKLVKELSLAMGAVAPRVIDAPQTGAFLVGKSLDDQVIERAAEIIRDEAVPIDDLRSTANYRRRMCGVLLAGLLERWRAHS